MNWNEYGAFIIEETKNLLAIDSPSGMTKKAAEHVAARFEALGYAPQTTRKDGVLVCLGGRDRENGLLLEAHMDTLGGMVCQIKANGRLKITPIGGLRAENVETENCRVVTKFDGVIEGTAQLINASTHVNEKYADTQRTFDTVEIVLDEPVADAEDVKKLGVRTGRLRLLRAAHPRDAERLHQEPLPRRQAERRDSAGLREIFEGRADHAGARGLCAHHLV